MKIQQARLHQLIKQPSPNGKRNYYALSLVCPHCEEYNTHIYYTLNKKLDHIERCKNDHKYIIPIERIQEIENQTIEQHIIRYNYILGDYITIVYK